MKHGTVMTVPHGQLQLPMGQRQLTRAECQCGKPERQQIRALAASLPLAVNQMPAAESDPSGVAGRPSESLAATATVAVLHCEHMS
jgi:hypothetical protein